jgi:hypothetical protein
VNALLRIGRIFSRDCFLCFGGALVLIASVGLAISLVDIIRYGDWAASTARDFLPTAAVLLGHGTAFLVAAYGLFKTRRWGPYFSALVSASEIALIAAFWSKETMNLRGIGVILLLFDVPILLMLVWALAEITREQKDRRASVDNEGRRHQVI